MAQSNIRVTRADCKSFCDPIAGDSDSVIDVHLVLGDSYYTNYIIHRPLFEANANLPIGDDAWFNGFSIILNLCVDDPDIFPIFVYWLYTKKVAVIPPGSISGTDNDTEYMDLARAHVLGDRLGSHTFQNAVIDAIIDKYDSSKTQHFSQLPGWDVVAYVYEHTSNGYALRDLMVDLYFREWDGTWLREIDENDSLNIIPPQFLVDFAKQLRCERGADFITLPLDPSGYYY